MKKKTFFKIKKFTGAWIIAYNFWIKINLIMLHWIKSRGESKNFSRGFGAEPLAAGGLGAKPPELMTFEDLRVK